MFNVSLIYVRLSVYLFMKNILICTIAYLILLFTNAQDVTLTPEILYLQSDGSQDYKLQYQVHNDTDTTLVWYWTVSLSDSWPESWEFSVLDTWLSYPIGVDATPEGLDCNTLLPKTSTLENFTFVDVDTNGKAGEGTVIFCIHQDQSYQNPIACTSYVTNIEEADEGGAIYLFPNPTYNRLNVQWSDEKYTGILIHNSQGIKVMEQTINMQNTVEIDTELLGPGIYFLCLYDGMKYVRKRFVKQ